MRLKISKENGMFVVDDPKRSGSPPVGRGHTMLEAIGSWVHHNQDYIGISFAVDETARPAELGRRRRELRKR